MDSLTQIVLGGAVAAAIVPARHRRAGLLAGAALGTLPDLDALFIGLFTHDPVMHMTMHRSLSHSLFVLPLAACAIWWFFKRRGGRVAEAPARWFWAILLALVTHPLLDAFTVYGTQLWWPLPVAPTMWSSVFIIDPAYTLWLLLACVAAWFAREKRIGGRALALGLVLSSGYLGWSLLAKHWVDSAATQSLTAMGLQDAPRFSVPMPLSTLLWRVVAMTPEGYVIGERSLVADHGPMRFQAYPSQTAALAQAGSIAAVRELSWFNRGFMRAQERDGQLVLSDLRMGIEPDYNFNFAVAERRGGQWVAIAPRHVGAAYRAAGADGNLGAALQAMWQRIWREPDQATAGNAGGTPVRKASK